MTNVDEPSEVLAGEQSVDVTRGPRPHRWRRRILSTVGVVVCVLIVAAVVAAFIPVPYYAITPGQGINVSTLITVPKDVARSHEGGVFLTDVELVPLHALTYAYFKYFDQNAEIDPNAEIIGTSTSAQYDEAGVIDMDNARIAATYVALRTLGYHVTSTQSGVSVYATIPGSPAAKSLPVGSVITAVNGKSTLGATALINAVRGLSPKSTVTITSHMIGTKKSTTKTVVLGAEYTSGSGTSEQVGCFSGRAPKSYVAYNENDKVVSCLGVELVQEYANSTLPFQVTIDADGIIGPSAGLAFTLGLIAKLDHSDLTAGQKIAATGTMSIDGAVGDVGGVAQKTIAVRNAGATIFFVPIQEYSVAKAHAGSTLRIIAVTNVSQALAALKSIGGRISIGSSKS